MFDRAAFCRSIVAKRWGEEGVVKEFMKRVEFDTNGGCWLWSGLTSVYGYGLSRTRGVTTAYRLSVLLFRGERALNDVLMHKCDVRCCVNPDHLTWGTQGDNMRDAASKGRLKNIPPLASRENGRGKLTPQQVEKVKARRSSGEILRTIAKDYEVSIATISLICSPKGSKGPRRVVGPVSPKVDA